VTRRRPGGQNGKPFDMPTDRRCNVLILHADQHRWDCLGAYGNREIRTPNIDALAADGTAYRNSFCCYPVCTPSRYSLLTGLYVHQHLGWTNHSTLPSGLPTFPRALKSAGYRTDAVGKMHFTPTYLDVGFERMRLAEQHGPGRWDDDYHRDLRDLGLVDRIDQMDQVQEFRDAAPPGYWESFGAVTSDLPEAHHSTTWIGDRAAEALGQWNDDRPSLLMAGFVKPHHPFDPPRAWADMYEPDELTLLPGWTEAIGPQDRAMKQGFFRYDRLTEAGARRALAMYYATISQIDHQVGRLIDLLKHKGLYDNTLIVYTSDHGDYMGFHHTLLKGGYMYDPLVKVPLIVKPAGGTGPGTVSDALVSNVDVAPTILSMAGCDVPAEMAGIDLTARPAGRDAVFADADRHYMVRTKDRKLLLCPDLADSLLFDLGRDPLEMDNLLGRSEHQADGAALLDRLARWALFDARTPAHLDERAPRIAADNVPDLDDDHRRRLQQYTREKMADAGDVLFDPGTE